MTKTYWMSFVNVYSLPKFDPIRSFKGVCIIDAVDMKEAIIRSKHLKCNPGGECMIYDITAASSRINPNYKNKLLTKKEAMQAIAH